MKIQITKLISAPTGAFRGYFEVVIDGTTFRQCRIIQQPGQRAYISGAQLPARLAWVTLVTFSPELRQEIERLVLPMAAQLKMVTL